jgi:hypothetical protein
MRKFSLQHILDTNKEYLELLNANRPVDTDCHAYYIDGEDENEHFVITYGYLKDCVKIRCALYENGRIKGSLQYLDDMRGA